MRNVRALVAPILLAHILYPQAKKPWNGDRLCGRLDYVQRTAERHDPNTFSKKRKALRDVSIGLYERREGEPCCEGLNAVEATKTSRSGHFEFKTKTVGSYWLNPNWNGRNSAVPVIYETGKKPIICSEQGIQLDDQGSADWWITVSVD